MDHELKLQQAQDIVNNYGHILSKLESSSLAHPRSLLNNDIDEIKQAINLLLWEIQGLDDTITQSLAQSYVFLGQFVSDEEAEMVERGQLFLQSSDLNPEDLRAADKAKSVVSRVKLEMEALMLDVKSFLR